MLLATQVFAGLAAVLHVVFFVFESVLWTRPAVFARFGIASQEQAETIRPMAYNQGFYNLALAVGVLVGVVLLSRSGDAFVAGKTLVLFGTGCMAFAGMVLASTGRTYWRAAAVQLVPAVLGFVLTLLT